MKFIQFVLFSIFVFGSIQLKAQLKDHYGKMSVHVSVPILVDKEQLVIRTGEGAKTTRNHEREQQMSLAFYLSVDDLNVTGTCFSGKHVNKNDVLSEIKTMWGELSNDRKTIDRLTLVHTRKKYSQPDKNRAILEEETVINIELKNIKLSGVNYKYVKGESEISAIRYFKALHYKPHYQIDEYKTERYVSTNLSGYGPSISIRYSVGKVVEKQVQESTKAMVIWHPDFPEIEDLKTISNGIYAYLVHKFCQVEGVIVLEGLHRQKIIDEIKLSESGLVDDNHKIKSGELMKPDFILILHAEEIKDDHTEAKRYKLSSKLKIVESNQIIDPNISFFVYGDRNYYKADVNRALDYGMKQSEFIDRCIVFTMGIIYP